MKIYHYTTIDSLALILKNKTIRFNRSDMVDDLEEGVAVSKGINLGKYTFISCWTEEKEESIPLWKMYTGGGNGVRIALEKEDLFKKYTLTPGRKKGYSVSAIGTVVLDFPPDEMYNQADYYLFPLCHGYDASVDGFYRKVKYVDDALEQAKTAIDVVKPSSQSGGQGGTVIANAKIGIFKNKRWEFEKETRFVLTIYPYNMQFNPLDGDCTGKMLRAMAASKELPFSHYDKELRDDAFDELEITLSPMATDSQRTIVEALCHQYAPNAVIRESDLYKKVKLK